ncbi:MAG: glutathione peroxidase [Fluviicola sp.]|nr:glutathione peroxidase [Fluviicola sp.]
MKSKIILLISVFGLISASFISKTQDMKEPIESIYDLSINSLDGTAIDLKTLKGKKILFVNVASKCGFTPQYEGLQSLHDQYGDKLSIIGVPCNQFGAQEPGSSTEIASFCQKNYGVSFQMTEKIDVKGDDQHPLYSWLTKKSLNGNQDSEVKWNFQKYLLDEEGRLIDVFSSDVKPLDEKIVSKL